MNVLPVFLIVFREALEVALTLVLVLLGTRLMTSRGKWIWGGIALGVVGSVGVAAGTEALSSSLEGMGQEMFNALILGLSALLIGYTVVWMQAHSASMARDLKAASKAVAEGRRPAFALSLIIGFTVLRDGSEVVLLSQGLFVTGISPFNFAVGCLGGIAAGALLGGFIYLGVVKLNIQIVFKAISLTLIFVAAGMASQAAGFLIAAGVLENFAAPVWDTSGILSENSFMGELAHVLFGYTSRPTGAQVIWFGVTAVVVFLLWVKVLGSGKKAAAGLVAAGSLLLYAGDALAIDKIYSPIVDAGEMEIEMRGTYTFDRRDAKDHVLRKKIGIGGAVQDWWFLEGYGKFKDTGEDNFDFEGFDLENRFQLTEQGEYGIDLGLYFEYEYAAKEENADKLEGKILLQTESGGFEHRANLTLEREIGSNSSDEYEGGIALSTRYRLNRRLQPGIELHSGVGNVSELGSFNDQEHSVGPALYGSLGGFSYELAALFGVSNEAPDAVVRWTLEYEWY